MKQRMKIEWESEPLPEPLRKAIISSFAELLHPEIFAANRESASAIAEADRLLEADVDPKELTRLKKIEQLEAELAALKAAV